MFGIDVRSNGYNDYGKAEMHVQAASYWVVRDLISGNAEIISKVMKNVDLEKVEEEYKNHPLHCEERPKHLLDDGSFEEFAKGMNNRITVE